MEGDYDFFTETRWKRRAYLYLNRLVILVPLLLRAFDRFSGATYPCPKITVLMDLTLCCMTLLRLFPEPLTPNWTELKSEAPLSVLLSLPPWSPGNLSPLFSCLLGLLWMSYCWMTVKQYPNYIPYQYRSCRALASPVPFHQFRVRHMNRAYD